MLDDDGIDDAEEKAANARPRRAVPERRPREPNDPRSSVLTPTGAFAARDAFNGGDAATAGGAVLIRETDATAESATDALTRLETRVRVELRALHTAAKSAKDHVAEAFRRVDAFGAGVISRDAFAESLAALGVAVSAAEAAALCRAADPEGAGETVSCAAFARRALRGAARADADDADVCRGWPVTDDDFVSKKIVYPRCRSFARAPTDLDPALIDRSMFKPDADLRLDFVYGYDGLDCAAPNVRVTADPNTVVYCAAAVAVVHDAARDAQAHFRGHTRDITCLTLCDAEVTVGGVTYPPKTLCATGQRVPSADAASYVDDDEDQGDAMASAEASAKSDAADAADAGPRPFVAVWDVRTLREVARVPLAADARAVAGVAFSPDGAMLVTAGCDNNHTVQVWDWRVARVGEPRRCRTRTRFSQTESLPLRTRANERSNEPPFREILKTSSACPRVSTPALVGLLHENTGFKERPGGVFGLEFDPFVNTRAGDDAVDDAADDAVDARFVSYGKKHVKAWTRLARTNEWVSRPMSFGSHGVRDVCSVAFLPPKSGKNRKAALVTGHPDGSLLVWRGGAAVQKIESAHGRGARAIQPDGSVAWGGGVRAMRLRLGSETGDHGDHGDHGAALVTGGADGALAQWAVVDGTLAGKITEPLVLAESSRRRHLERVRRGRPARGRPARGRPRDRRRARHGPRRRGHVAVRAVGRGPAPRARDGERADAGAQGFPPRGVLAPLGPGPILHRVRLRRRARVGRGADGDDQAVRPGVRGDVHRRRRRRGAGHADARRGGRGGRRGARPDGIILRGCLRRERRARRGRGGPEVLAGRRIEAGGDLPRREGGGVPPERRR